MIAVVCGENAVLMVLQKDLSYCLFLWLQDLSDVRAQSKEADRTLQMD